MEYEEAQARLKELSRVLGSGIKGEEYKAALQEYMALKAAIQAAGGQASGGSNEAVPWWQRRGGPSLL